MCSSRITTRLTRPLRSFRETDSSLGNLTTLLQQAEQIASADVGSNVTQTQRTSDISVVQSLYNQSLAIGNQQFNGQYLFGGATGKTQPFVENNGVVEYAGSAQTLQNNDQQRNLAVASNQRCAGVRLPLLRREWNREHHAIAVGNHKTFRPRRRQQRRHPTRDHHARQWDRDQNQSISPRLPASAMWSISSTRRRWVESPLPSPGRV